MLETINLWLPILTAVVGGLLGIWKISNGLKTTLTNLINSVDRLNEHLTTVQADSKEHDKRLDAHDIRLENHEQRLKTLEENSE
ncbi:hypothetical protein [Lysinibacillus sp. NPDC086135]|uniref:hypothetical protein n=1 Tax=Lysinibacillus sp. NPDC086135 TaxID=3364130 RepID=UPI0037F39D2B